MTDLQTIRMAVAALRSAADDLMKTDPVLKMHVDLGMAPRAILEQMLAGEEGRTHIWLYDITSSRIALSEALDRQNYDSIQVGADAIKAGKKYALIGPGIEDHHFSTPEELVKLLEWLCRDGGYLSCYFAGGS